MMSVNLQKVDTFIWSILCVHTTFLSIASQPNNLHSFNFFTFGDKYYHDERMPMSIIF